MYMETDFSSREKNTGWVKNGKKEKIKAYVLSLLISLAAGTLSAVFSGGMKNAGNLVEPPLTPPSWVFPAVWTVLYVLMGISAARVYLKKTEDTKRALTCYGVQLIVNIIWPVLYFMLEMHLAAFIWILVLLALIAVMMIRFKAVDRPAAYLQLPYFIWTAFAAYLNLGIYLLNG